MKHFKIFFIAAIILAVSGFNLALPQEAQAFTPSITSVVYQDNNHNGTIDRIKIIFNGYVTACIFEAGDWILAGGTVGLAGPTNRLNGAGLFAACDGSTDYFYLVVSGNSGMTGAATPYTVPTIQYKNQGFLDDMMVNEIRVSTSSTPLLVGDEAEPVIVSTYPGNGATGVSVATSSVSMTFSEPLSSPTASVGMSPVTGWGTPSWSSDYKTYNLPRTTNFSYDTDVSISMSGMDTSANPLVSGVSPALPASWSFRTQSAPADTTVSASQSIVSASPTSVAANGSSTSTVTVTVKNSAGSALSGKTVTLNSSRGLTDTIIIADGTTDGAGRFYFQVRSGTAGSATFTAVSEGVTISDTETITFTSVLGAISASRSLVYASPSSVLANNSDYSNITVTVRDSSDNLLSGKTVSLYSSRGSTDMISIVSGTTNSSGQATFQVRSGTTGSAVLTAIADGTTISQTAVVSFYSTASGVSASRSSVYASPSSVLANNSDYSTITVAVRDSSDNSLSGKTVSLSSNRGATDTITIVNGTTNSSGQATFRVKSGSAGNATLTAVADGVTIYQTVTVSFTATTVSALNYGDTFKESGTSAVYYYATNGKRYVFPTQAIYFSWFSDFSAIKTVSHSQITSITFGGNVVAKPGTYLIQFVSMDTPFRVMDPKIYALTSAGQLRWVRSASVASSLYGSDWERKIAAVPEVYRTNYGGGVAGADINSAADYNKSSVESTARAISNVVY